MVKETKKIELTFRIHKVTTIKFSLGIVNSDLKIEKENFLFEYGFIPDIDITNELLSITSIIKIYQDSSRTQQLSELVVKIDYKIVNLNDVLDLKKEQFSLPNAFMQTFLSIAFSTVRGILIAKTEGSILNDIYLPVANPSDLMNAMATPAK